MTTTPTRDELIALALPLVPIAASKFRLPPGWNRDDAESVANESLVESATRFDATAGVPWKNFAYHQMKFAIRTAIAKQRRHPAAALQVEREGVPLPLPIDERANDPAEIAAARDLVAVGRNRMAVSSLRASLPSPAVVADRVTQLRAAMFGAVGEDDVAAVMQSVVTAAKGGDLKAAKLVMDLLAPGRSGVTVNQQAVVIRTGDLD